MTYQIQTIRDRGRRLQIRANAMLVSAKTREDFEEYAVVSALAALAYGTVARRRLAQAKGSR